jgi:hypothetical protein
VAGDTGMGTSAAQAHGASAGHRSTQQFSPMRCTQPNHDVSMRVHPFTLGAERRPSGMLLLPFPHTTQTVGLLLQMCGLREHSSAARKCCTAGSG